MRIVFIGCVKFSVSALRELLSLKSRSTRVVGIVSKFRSPLNSDFTSLIPLARRHDIPCLFADRVDEMEMAKWIRDLAPDVIYCFGWSHLLGPKILNIPPKGAIGYHPSPLPLNRGRHPIIWTLALGLKRTASTFFFMDQGADSGDILSQETIPVSTRDHAASLYRKLTSVARRQIRFFTPRLASGQFVRKKQNPKRANYWRKRTDLDGKIDWRMSAIGIYNLIRALWAPYSGAFCEFRGRRNRIWQARVHKFPLRNLEPGKVISVRGKTFTVKCGEHALTVVKHEFANVPRKGEYLL